MQLICRVTGDLQDDGLADRCGGLAVGRSHRAVAMVTSTVVRSGVAGVGGAGSFEDNPAVELGAELSADGLDDCDCVVVDVEPQPTTKSISTAGTARVRHVTVCIKFHSFAGLVGQSQ